MHTWTMAASQRALGLFFAVVALLFLAQTAMGGFLAHYRVEPGGFYSLDLSALLPYKFFRLTSCGVVTMMAPETGKLCARVSWVSPVPGGRSMTR
jgi:nitric oxide reductase large subunit